MKFVEMGKSQLLEWIRFTYQNEKNINLCVLWEFCIKEKSPQNSCKGHCLKKYI